MRRREWEREAGELRQSFHPRRGGKWAGRTARFGTVDGGLGDRETWGAVLDLPPIDLPEPCGSCSPLPPAARVEGWRGCYPSRSHSRRRISDAPLARTFETAFGLLRMRNYVCLFLQAQPLS